MDSCEDSFKTSVLVSRNDSFQPISCSAQKFEYPMPNVVIKRPRIPSRSTLGLKEAASAIYGSFSGMGGGSGSCFTLEICPDLLIAGIAVAAAAAFWLIYEAITMAGARRKKRNVLDLPSSIINIGKH